MFQKSSFYILNIGEKKNREQTQIEITFSHPLFRTFSIQSNLLLTEWLNVIDLQAYNKMRDKLLLKAYFDSTQMLETMNVVPLQVRHSREFNVDPIIHSDLDFVSTHSNSHYSAVIDTITIYGTVSA